MCTNIRTRLSTAPAEVPYDRAMDSLIEPSSLAGLEPDTISISNVNLSLGTGAARVHILKDISLRVAPGEAIGLIGPSGSGKSTLADGDGGTGASRQRRGGGQRHPFQCPRRGRAGALSRPPGRHRVPVVPSDPDHDGAGKCRGAAGTRRQSRCVAARRAGTDIGRSRRPPASLSHAIVRRRAAARRAGPRAGARSRHPGGGRADRQSRRGHRQADRRSVVHQARRARHDAGAGDPRHLAGAALRPRGAAALGPDRRPGADRKAAS